MQYIIGELIKKHETKIGSFDTYIAKMKEIQKISPSIRFIIQSDVKQFIDSIRTVFKDCIVFEENISSTTDNGIHNEHTTNENYQIVKYFFAIILIMSQCKYIICSSGNCSIWMMYYRGHASNVHQFYNNAWM